MVIRSTFLIVTFVSLMQLTGCDPPEGPKYNFSVTGTVYPSDADTISIGDTLYYESSFSTKLTDQKLGEIIDYSNSTDLGGTLGFGDFKDMISNPTQDSTTTKYVDYVKIEGDVFNDKSIPIYWSINQTRYEEKDGKYYLKVGMILKKKGTFLFGVKDLYSNGQVGKRNSANFSIKFANTNQHLHYFEDKYGKLSDHDRAQTYCFVVK